MIWCIKFTPLERGALRGFCDLALDSGMVVHDCTVMENNGRRWVNLPGKPQLDRDKNLVRGESGKIIYVPVLSIADRVRRDAFNAQAFSAVDEFQAKSRRQEPPQQRAQQRDDGRPWDDPIGELA
jgi:DNA-binding cell septation regulator SpoVG